jgi:hypothetical protein
MAYIVGRFVQIHKFGAIIALKALLSVAKIMGGSTIAYIWGEAQKKHKIQGTD